MRGAGVIRFLLSGILIFVLDLVVSRYSEAAMYAYEVCTLKSSTIEHTVNDGYSEATYTSTNYFWDCVTYYMYLWDGGGGSSGNGDMDDPGAGGGSNR